MKFVRLINWDVINWDDVSYFYAETAGNNLFQYVCLKNGKTFDFHDAPSCFSLEKTGENVNYEFCVKCNTVYLGFLLEDIQFKFSSGLLIYDMEEGEDGVWKRFSEWAEAQSNLTPYTPPTERVKK